MKIILIAVMLIWSVKLSACDVCGGISGGPSFGNLASTSYHQIGLRSTFRSFNSYLFGIEHSREQQLQEELFVRWQIQKRLQLIASVPYLTTRQVKAGKNYWINGIGDPSLLTSFVLLDKKDSLNETKRFLSAGLGVKIPLGATVSYEDDQRNLYPGSGATDLIFNMAYFGQLKKQSGIQSEATVLLRGKDNWGYQFGNSLSMNVLYFRKLFKGNYKWIPTFGLQYDYQKEARINGKITSVAPNDLMLVSPRIGLNLITPNWMFTSLILHPVIQNVNNGQVKQNLQLSVGATYLIKNKRI
jgi:hypothetical protein